MIIKVLSCLLACAMLLTGCGGNTFQNPVFSSTETSSAPAESSAESSTGSPAESTADPSDMFTDRDMEIGYDESTSAIIQLNGDSASCESSAVTISGSTITIRDEGTYLLYGVLEDGMIIVDAADTDKVQLVLGGTQISSASSAAIYVREADKVFLTTAADSQNVLSNGGSYTAIDENNIDAVIFSKADLTLNGAGSLTIQAAAGHGIVSKDDLVLTSGTFQITAESHGLSGKDSVRIANGSYTITAGKDGIHAENADDTSLGFVYIANGTFQITAEGDGISSATQQQIEGGAFIIQAGGGSSESAVKSSGQTFERQRPGTTVRTDAETDSTVSTKGIKAGGDLSLNGGTFTIDSADDALHSNGNVTFSGGSCQFKTGDDGIHADAAVTIAGGTIEILQSYEGIEGQSIDITGGEITLTASDDGLNAAGGMDGSGFGQRGDLFSANADCYITISGGFTYINASGDGVDSNGTITISGGATYVSGPTSAGDGSLDCNGEAVITGGIFAAAGSSGMAQNFSTSSTQGAMLVTTANGAAGDMITLTDASGKELVSWKTERAYSSILISCPELTQNATYTLVTGGTSTEVTMTSLIYGGGSFGGMGGGRGGKGLPGN